MRKLVLISMLVFVISSLQAQESGNFGVSAGINVANMSFKSEGVNLSLTSKVAFKGYVFYDLPLGTNFSLENELGYDGMGFKFNQQGEDLNESVSYLTLAILPKFNVQETGLSFFAGPSLGFLMSANTNENGQSMSDKDSYNSIDLFGEIGASYFLPMGFGLTARYMGGLTNIAKGAQDGTSAHNSVWSFTLAYKFNTGGK
jgi:outer membrane immunogenic protein